MTRTDYLDDAQAPRATNIVPAASAIVLNEEGNILLHRRRDNDLWALPGGAMEIGESIAETVVREVEEETGLVVKPGYLIGIYTNPNHVIAFSDGEVRQEFSICFYCTIVSGSLQVSDESYEVAFFPLQAIADLKMHPSIRKRIEHYQQHQSQPIIN